MFVSVGTIEYRVTAIDSSDLTIAGPTDWAEFTCYQFRTGESGSSGVSGVDGSCLTICNPPDFYFNTILLSWTPIIDASSYKLNMMVLDRPITLDVDNSWFRLNVNNEFAWNFLVKLSSIAYNVEAYDERENLIAGPTDWSLFIKN